MTLPRPSAPTLGIRYRLLLWFLLGSLLPVLLLGYLAYTQARSSILANQHQHMAALALSRVQAVRAWASGQADHVEVLARNPAITACARLLARQMATHGPLSVPYEQAVVQCRPALALQTQGGLDDVLLVGRDGRVLFSLRRQLDFGSWLFDGNLGRTRLARVARQALAQSPDVHFVPHEFYYPAGREAAFWLAPLQDGDLVQGLLVVRLRNDELFRLFSDYTSLGQSGESMLLRRDEDGRGRVLAPLRHVQDAAFRYRIPLAGKQDAPLWQALFGRSGAGQAVDYRGREVLAAWQTLPELGWGLVVKVDADEALAPLNLLRDRIVQAILLLVLSTALLAWWAGRRLIRPLLQLVEVSARLGLGEQGVRVVLPGKDEIGQLGASFNAMAEQVEQAQQRLRSYAEELELKVVRRTLRLQQHQLQLEDAEKLAGLGYCIADLASQRAEWSSQLYRLLEYPPDSQGSVDALLQRVHPDDLVAVLSAYASSSDDGYQLSYRLLFDDGRIKHVREVGRQQCDEFGTPMRLVAMLQDVTDHVEMAREHLEIRQALEQERLAHAEVAAHNAEARARVILQAMEDGVLGLSPEGTVVFCNAAAAGMLGYATEELIGQPLDDCLKHYNAYGLLQTAPSPLLRNLALNLEHSSQLDSFGSRQREPFPVAYRLLPLEAWIGDLAAVLTFRDISEQRHNEAQLEQMSRAVTQSPAGVLITDPLGVIEYVNPRFLAMTGFDEHEVIGNKPALFRSDKTSADVYAELWLALLSGNSWHGEILNRRKDGSELWVMQMISPVRDSSGKLTHFVSVQEDITAQRMLANRMEEAKLAAEAATRAKSAFLANMSHEIRTPMNAIIGMADLALRDQLPERTRNFLGKLLRSARGLLEIINDVLDFSKIEAGRLEVVRQPFALDEVLASLADMLAMRLEGKPVDLVFDVAPEVPQQLEGDALRLGQILLNLLGNAVKFTAVGEVVLNVACDGERLLFTVRDTGIGMSQEQVDGLFAPFVQADASTQRRFGGTGLGLVISNQLVQLMGGGGIAVSSVARQGSVFSFGLQLPQLACHVPPILPAMRVVLGLQQAAMHDSVKRQLHAWGVPFVSLAAGAGYPQPQAGDVWLLDCDQGAWSRGLPAQGWPQDAHCLLLSRRSASSSELLPNEVAALPVADVLVKPLPPARLLAALRACKGTEVSSPTDGQPSIPTLRLDGKRVLVVDDVALNQEVVAAYLQEAGAMVTFAGNGQEALQQLARQVHDVVLMDCHMPVMDGFAATRRIRECGEWQTLPVIALTANAVSGSREEVLAAGMNDFISKPIDQVQLFATLARHGVAAEPLPQAVAASADPGPVVADWQGLAAAGINVEEGLQRAMGKPEVYRKWLRLFAESQADFTLQAEQALATGELVVLQRLAHTLKGAASNVSAEWVRELALQLETAAKEQAPSPQLQLQLRAVAPVLDGVRKAVAALHGGG